MGLKFFHVPSWDPGSVEAELNAFLARHRVVTVERRFVDSGHRLAPVTTVSVSQRTVWMEPASGPSPETPAGLRRRKVRRFGAGRGARKLRDGIFYSDGSVASLLVGQNSVAVRVGGQTRSRANGRSCLDDVHAHMVSLDGRLSASIGDHHAKRNPPS